MEMIEVSAKTGKNINKLFTSTVRSLCKPTVPKQ